MRTTNLYAVRRVFRIIMRSFGMISLAYAPAIAARAQFLVPDQQYRCPPSDDDCKKTHKPSAFELGMSEHNRHPYSINYVEYTDKGELWSPQELDDAISQISSAADNGKQHPLVVVYVHGWQNNASELSGDVVKFRGLVSRLAEDYPVGLPGQTPQVVGVYLAWRGLTFTVEPFKHIVSYWPRRQVAKSVGRSGIFRAIEQIKNAVNASPTVRDNTFLIFAGHSFGARVLENAVDGLDARGNPGFMRQYLDQMHKVAQRTQAQHAQVLENELFGLSKMPADLIIYVNAATSSEKTHERVRQIRSDCKVFPSHPICRADPFFIAFTSTNDLATGIVMPIANFVFPDLVSDRFRLISAANSPWMHTHDAPKQGCPNGELTCFDISGQDSPPEQYYLPRIVSKLQVPSTNADPFWIFNVHSNLINGHGDVWNPNVSNMLTVILRNNGHFEHVRNAAAIAVAP
jgi:hypothetical protein